MFFGWLFQCHQLSMFKRFALSSRHFYSKLKSTQFTTQLAPLVFLSTYRLTQFHQFQSSKHTVAVVKPIAATIDIALYLHNSTSHHEHSYSKCALADCSLIFSFVYNYDRSGVYSNSRVGAAAYCFTDVNLQGMG